MDKKAAAVRIAELVALIREHDRRYYVEAAPDISDLEYDRLVAELRKLEETYPDLVAEDSPTQRVGDQPVSDLEQVEHRVPMLSIENTYSVDELQSFADRTAKLLDDDAIEWVVELKVDGVAVSLVYEDGLLVRGVTRGNGQVGDDITHNVRTLADVPLRLLDDDVPGVLEVRGEIYMTNPDLVRLNERQQELGLPPFANTRNVTAGSIRTLDPRVCAERKLRMFCHGIGYCEGVEAKTHVEFLQRLRDWGLPTTPHAQRFPDFRSAVEHCDDLIGRLHELDFEVDGLVLKVDRFDSRDKLGSTSKSPRWLVAYKFEKYEAATRLNDIRVQIGKSGAITPVAELEPVEIADTIVSRASLHNAEEIERKDVRVGDVVIVEKAGKIIPHIVRVEKHERKGRLAKFEFPTKCPSCDTELIKDEGGVYIRCPNSKCPAQLKERIRYFASRNAMDVEGLGDKLVDQLVDAQLVGGYGDLYQLSLEDLAGLDRMGVRSSKNVLQGIEVSKQRGLARLLNALSIRHVGQRVATVLADEFPDIELLQQASVAELSAIHEIGDTIAESVHSFLHSEDGIETIADLRAAGVVMKSTTQRINNDPLPFSGKTFVVTGVLQKYTRDEIHKLIEQNGGRAVSSVSKNTSYLVAGESAGSKLAKALKLSVPVLSEEDFEKLL
jgi:DNA ligase (NAD+)